VQVVASVLLQDSVLDAPATMVPGAAAMLTVGVGGAEVTVTVTVRLTDPPGPVQPSVKVVSATRPPEDWEPLVALGPVQPPDAVHPVALALVQESVDAPPLVTVVGVAVRLRVGTGAELTVTVAESLPVPPGPLQVRV